MEDRIRWAPRLQRRDLKRLYEADATGVQDLELCDDVGYALLARCDTYGRAWRSEVACPRCGAVFTVAREGPTLCAGDGCLFEVDWSTYWRSMSDHYAWPGRARAAYEDFQRVWQRARTYGEKIIAIDQLIHAFHLDERGAAVKSAGSKLLEGSKRDVVRFLDDLSGCRPQRSALDA